MLGWVVGMLVVPALVNLICNFIWWRRIQPSLARRYARVANQRRQRLQEQLDTVQELHDRPESHQRFVSRTTLRVLLGVGEVVLIAPVLVVEIYASSSPYALVRLFATLMVLIACVCYLVEFHLLTDRIEKARTIMDGLDDVPGFRARIEREMARLKRPIVVAEADVAN